LEEELALSEPKIISLQSLQASSLSVVASAFWSSKNYNHLFVLDDYESAAYFHNDFEQITDGLDIQFFPSAFKKEGDYSKLNSSHQMLRSEALLKLQSEGEVNKKVFVTYPAALFEKVVNNQSFGQNMLFIKKNQNLDVENLTSFLVDLGFSKQEFVYEPGHFAIRGGIIDIYSYGNEHPYRIELFDQEVESIRLFEPETQLSLRKLMQVRIVPDVETAFEDEERESLIDALPSNTILWVNDLEHIGVQFGKFEEALEKYVHLPQEELEHERPLRAEDFLKREALNDLLQEKCILELEKGSAQSILKKSAYKTIAFQTKAQPAFNRNFDMLIKHLQEKNAEAYRIFICSENSRQLVRLENIFRDLGHEIIFTPIAISIQAGFEDDDLKIICYTDHEIFQRYHKYKVKQAYSKGKALSIRTLNELSSGDFVAHIDHGVGVYSGLQKIEVKGVTQEAVRIIYRDNDVLYVNINSLHKISKFTGKDGTPPKIHKLGSGTWDKLKSKAKKKVKDIAAKLIKLYAARKAVEGFAHQPDTYLQHELEGSFMFEDTPDQYKASQDVKADMEKDTPMDRLVCGDVGFGKTEVAVRAAFKTVNDSRQAAILVPTTILAYQHYQTFKDRLRDLPCRVDYLNRFKSAKQKRETLEDLAAGKIDIIIGTHALLSKDVKFKELGLLIIDEEQKFGVAAKEKIRSIRTNVDTLTLTATPIPRTLQFSLLGARDLSIINTAPPNRQPVETEVSVFNDELIREAIYYEVTRNGQVFFVHNRVKDLREMRDYLQNLCPDVSFGFAHGQMKGDELEEAILNFMGHEFDVLVSTNIVESGVDIPNANTMIVNNAHQFGLSDLHQLRGRVGRSNKKAFCYLLAPPMSTLPNESKKRLQTLEQYSDLGSGFQIAMRDLDIRGAGNLLGGEQSGFITDIGLETYKKILDEALRELKQTEFKELFKDEIKEKEEFVSDCTVDTDIEILIPDSYVESIQERLVLYNRLDRIEEEEDLQVFKKELEDRFGAIPKEVADLFKALRCRWIGKSLGFEKLILKKNQARLYFIRDPESVYFESELFRSMVQHIQTKLAHARLKQVGRNFMLVVDGIHGLDHALLLLKGLKQ